MGKNEYKFEKQTTVPNRVVVKSNENPNIIKIGIDQSINSTGICINDAGTCHYYLITSKLTKKQRLVNETGLIQVISYGKEDGKGLEYSQKEYIKANNIYHIVYIISKILEKYRQKHKEIIVNVEGIAYGQSTSSSLIDLSILSGMIRMMLIETQTPFKIISPTELKKFATGNGGISKEGMIDAWLRLQPQLKGLDIKVDDLADAFFLSQYV